VNNDAILVRVGSTLGGVGFVLLFVEAARVVFGKHTLSGVESLLPWIGLGLLIVGAVLLALAVSGASDGGGEPADG
jgi:hypothetical protein